MKRSTDPAVPTAERYRAFAEVEARGMSACYERWAAGVADDSAVLSLIDRLPAPKRQPNLVFSAARYLGAQVSDYPQFADWLTAHWDEVEQVCRTHATQTNEPARCATLLPALAAFPGPIALVEVGASAGLCLYPDRYSYRYRSAGGEELSVLDPASGPSEVVLDCLTTGPVPIPTTLPQVVWRAGIDLHPLDIRNPADAAWLNALIWPEHEDRRERLRSAALVASREPVELRQGDLVENIDAVVRSAPAGSTVVVFHTAVLAYLDVAARQKFVDLVRGLPVNWVANEGQGVVPGVMEGLRRPPTSTSDFVLSVDGKAVAFTQPHGRELHWLR